MITEVTHIPFPSIEQYRHVVKSVRERATHNGLPLPTLRFYGTVKLHGTNAAVGFTESGEMFTQSRSQIITPEADNAGFAAWVRDNRIQFPDNLRSTIIYGEWCGGNIQKGVAINGLPKMFVPFAVHQEGKWLTHTEIIFLFYGTTLRPTYTFPFWIIDIDFSRPEDFQNKLAELTQAVEDECPVGKAFGVSGVGEGIVWWPEAREDFNVHGLYFKVKGEKHSETKVRTLAPVDTEKIANIRELVSTIVTPHRLEKKLEGIPLETQSIGLYLKTVNQDVLKEEKDTIEASGLPLTDVMKYVSGTAKQFFMEKLKEVA